MAKIHHSDSIVVQASIDKIFDHFNNPNHMQKWITSNVKYRDFAPPLKLGSTFVGAENTMGSEIATEYEVIEFNPPYQCVFQISGVLAGEVTHTFEEQQTGVQVTIDFNVDTNGFLNSILSPLIKQQVKKLMRDDLSSFKTYIES